MLKRTNIVCYIILNIITILIFLPWLIVHYATDTYNIINIGYEQYAYNYFLIDGRLFTFLIMKLASILNISHTYLNFILLFLALIISNISVLIIKNITYNNMKEKSKKNIIFSYIIAYTFIYNFMYIENLYFFESFVMAISILLNLIAARIFVKKEKYYLINSFLLVLISIFLYQGNLTAFFVFSLFFMLLKENSMKDFIVNIGILIVVLFVVCVINFLFIKIVSIYLGIEQTRIHFDIIQNIIYILTTKGYMLIHTSGNFYRGIYIYILSFLATTYIFLCKNNNESNKIFILFILIAIFIVDLPYLISLDGFNVGRTRFIIGALSSMVIICIFYKLKIYSNLKNENIIRLLYGFIILYFLLNVINYIDIIINTKIVNENEKQYVAQIDKYITEYELNNDIKVDKIQLVYDNDANNIFYSNCTRKNIMTWNACSCSWSAVGCINLYTGRKLVPLYDKYIEIDMDEMYTIKGNVLYVKIGCR